MHACACVCINKVTTITITRLETPEWLSAILLEYCSIIISKADRLGSGGGGDSSRLVHLKGCAVKHFTPFVRLVHSFAFDWVACYSVANGHTLLHNARERIRASRMQIEFVYVRMLPTNRLVIRARARATTTRRVLEYNDCRTTIMMITCQMHRYHSAKRHRLAGYCHVSRGPARRLAHK